MVIVISSPSPIASILGLFGENPIDKILKNDEVFGLRNWWFGFLKFFSSRILTSEEHAEVVNDLLNFGFKNLTYSRHTTGTVIVETLNDSLGCLVDVHKQIKMMPTRFKIKLGISYIDRDRAVIVKEKFWDNEDSRPKGYHFIEDLT